MSSTKNMLHQRLDRLDEQQLERTLQFVTRLEKTTTQKKSLFKHNALREIQEAISMLRQSTATWA